jgi:hypothetical protein
MDTRITLFIALLLIVLSVCAIYIAHRLRRISMQRADAERRAVEAFEDVQRLAKDLRSREAPAVDPALPPGQRLQRQYPGARKKA